jgi:hypothetical protein
MHGFSLTKRSVLSACLLAASVAVPAFAETGTVREPKTTHSTVSTAISPPIISREKWHAKPALPGMREQKIVGIVLHHSGERRNYSIPLEAKLRNLQAFSQAPGRVSPTHMKPAWPDVPYHFYIGANGQIAEGRDMRYAGDTNTKYDPTGYIQVVIEGDFEKEIPDPAQLAATRELLVWLLQTWDLPVESISVHKDHAQTDCPGAHFMAMLPKLLAEVSAQTKRSTNDVCLNPPAWPGAHAKCAPGADGKRAEPAADWRNGMAQERR